MKTKVPRIYEEVYMDAEEHSIGWCTECQAFTRECTESDASSYDCPDCEQDTVVGASVAMLEGCFELKGSAK